MFNPNGKVIEVLFVEQVGEIDLRERDGQIFSQSANLQRIQCEVYGYQRNNLLPKLSSAVMSLRA